MRIVHLLLTRRFAGTERHVLELAAAQAQAGHDVSLVLRGAASQSRPDAIAHRVDPGVKVHLVGDLLSGWQASGLVRRLRPDVAHAHLSGGCRALKSVKACLRVATLHIRYKPRQHAHLDGLIAIAPWQLAEIPMSLRERTVQIDNWTHDCRAEPGARERLRRAHGIADDAFLIGTLGRVERSKGHDVLLESFTRARLPDARLAIVGHGDEWKRMRERAPASVVMPGFTDAPRDWLAAFDLFVSCARSEPFGLVLLEAMQAGLPIVATRSEGAQHLAGLMGAPLVPVDDVDAMATAISAAHGAGLRRVAYPLTPYRIDAALPRIDAFYRAGLERR
ncbi:glycosyltransferase [Cognatilysobacter bugurensis]|uniref:Amylovoran biosynthesis protein AmsD n=1 Tax=Cognatilysobacter bugurensis TaxID=543356 RepID=A0A918W7R7_9GAMM|nr:glycosyltransferase [Lysobacter bugurensis]GHA82634.1 amylovoran biosynthesis protein AmsD [Lysobacter bugurensis]